MNTKNTLAHKYIWLFLLGLALQSANTGLLFLAPDRPAWHFLGGVMAGLASVALGAFIYLAASAARKSPAGEGEAQQ
jgi:hypothetical protein